MTLELSISLFSLVVGIAGLALSAYLFLRSMQQTEDFAALRTAAQTFSQFTFNSLWRIGDKADKASATESLPDAHGFAQGIGDMSHISRNALLAFSRDYIQFVPSYEAAWEPHGLEPLPKPTPWRRFLLLRSK
jgi:hypothetical protein